MRLPRIIEQHNVRPGRNSMMLPKGARIIDVRPIHGKIALFAECVESAPPYGRTFDAFITGEAFNLLPTHVYVGSATIPLSISDSATYHVYEDVSGRNVPIAPEEQV